jgi:L-lactate dehydrogenase complex protein LldF
VRDVRRRAAASRRAFDARVDDALDDAALQRVLRDGQDYVQALAAPARAQPAWDAALDEIARVRTEALAHLDRYVAQFAVSVERAGGHVFVAADAAAAREHVVGLARERGVRRIVKSKSMVTEEIGLNPALEAAGAEVVETDLGEYIVQLSGERPFHILKPAIHLSVERIRALFSTVAGRDVGDDPPALTRYARDVLRGKFLAAEMGITGANFGVAATGSIVLVTNEGNGRMTTTLPRTHVVVMGVERLVPALPDLGAILTVLPRAGVGLRTTAYVTAITGPRRSGEADGPEELHVVIVDNGRSRLLGGRYEQVLSCIRCGACLDVCPVYRKIGGHAYDAVYSGPIGAVLSPLLEGLERHPDLPFASSLCGACTEVCSARIPLAEMIRELREDAVAQGLVSPAWGAGLAAYAEVTRRPRLWRALEGLALPLLQRAPLSGPRLRGRGPLAPWTAERDLPRGEGRSFRAAWDAHEVADRPAAPTCAAAAAPDAGSTSVSPVPPAAAAGSCVEPTTVRLDRAALAELFLERLGELGATGAVVADAAAARHGLEQLAGERGWRVVAGAPALRWDAAPWRWTDEARDAEVGLCEADWGVADTGSVVVCSGAQARRDTSLLPPVAAFFVPASRLVAGLGDVLRALSAVDPAAALGSALPSCVSVISGPSGTSDIAATHVTGVHGPGEVLVWLLVAE